MQAHLIGGVPEAEVGARESDFAKLVRGVAADALFQSERPGYFAFLQAIGARSAIKTTLEADPALQRTITAHRDALEAWWGVTRDDLRPAT